VISTVPEISILFDISPSKISIALAPYSIYGSIPPSNVIKDTSFNVIIGGMVSSITIVLINSLALPHASLTLYCV
jgi:hypothetical protein